MSGIGNIKPCKKSNLNWAVFLAGAVLVIGTMFFVGRFVNNVHSELNASLNKTIEVQTEFFASINSSVKNKKASVVIKETEAQKLLLEQQSNFLELSKDMYDKQFGWLNIWLVVVGVLFTLACLIIPLQIRKVDKDAKEMLDNLDGDIQKKYTDLNNYIEKQKEELKANSDDIDRKIHLNSVYRHIDVEILHMLGEEEYSLIEGKRMLLESYINSQLADDVYEADRIHLNAFIYRKSADWCLKKYIKLKDLEPETAKTFYNLAVIDAEYALKISGYSKVCALCLAHIFALVPDDKKRYQDIINVLETSLNTDKTDIIPDIDLMTIYMYLVVYNIMLDEPKIFDAILSLRLIDFSKTNRRLTKIPEFMARLKSLPDDPDKLELLRLIDEKEKEADNNKYPD